MLQPATNTVADQPVGSRDGPGLESIVFANNGRRSDLDYRPP